MINIFLQRKQHDADAERWFPRLPYFVARFVLYLSFAGLFFLNVLPTGYASFTGVQPAFMFMMVFYWAVFYPSALPFWVTFIMGVCFDLISGFPVGGTAFLLLGSQWWLREQRRFLYGQPFFVIWLGFSLMCYAMLFMQWGIISLFTWHVMPLIPVVTNTLLTITLFPFIVILFHRLRKALRAFSNDAKSSDTVMV